MAIKTEFTYPSAEGHATIHAIEWAPDAGQTPRAVLQIIHGVAEYVDRYDPFARYLAGRGFAVFGADHLGHGGSVEKGGIYGYFADTDGWNCVVSDVERLSDLARRKYPGIPYFMLGHSMGSFVLRTCLIDYPGTIDGAIVMGTGQEPPFSVAMGKRIASLQCAKKDGAKKASPLMNRLSMGSYNKRFRPNRTAVDWLSRDETEVDKYAADTLCGFVPTAGLFRDMMGALQYISNADNLRKMDPSTPVRLTSGAEDPVGAFGRGVETVRRFFADSGCRDLTVKLYPGARHEILNETCREEVYADLAGWLDAHIAGAAVHNAAYAAEPADLSPART